MGHIMITPGAIFIETVTAEAVESALGRWTGRGTGGVLAFVPENTDSPATIATLQAACRKQALPLGGAMFPSLVAHGHLVNHGAVLLFGGDAPPPLLIEASGGPRGAELMVEQAADRVESQLSEDAANLLFCVFDGLDPLIADHLDRLYLRLADLVDYIGVNAGSERFVPTPCLFDAERLQQGGMLLQALPNHRGGFLRHGFPTPDRLITVTSATGNRVVQIEWKPALDVYRQLILDQYGVTLDRDNFYSLAVNFPFGILRADGEVLVRIPVALDESGAICCVGEIPSSSVLTLLDARTKNQDAVQELAEKLRPLSGPDQAMLFFYCAGRRLQRGDDAPAELLKLAPLAPGGAFGALTLGEIGSIQGSGYPLFHNACIVGLPWPK